MPSTKKTLHFMSSALVTAVSVAVLGYSMSTDWTQTNLRCAREDGGPINGSATVTLGLFGGTVRRDRCPSFSAEGGESFQVTPELAKVGGASVALHAVAVCLAALCLLSSAGSILISLYNSVSNPYETYMGPIGVYVCSSLSACLSAVVLIVFVANVYATTAAEDLVELRANDEPVFLRDKSSEMLLGYFLVIPYTVLSVLAIVLIYLYDHAAYKHKREQQRPTDDAPKEIMMY